MTGIRWSCIVAAALLVTPTVRPAEDDFRRGKEALIHKDYDQAIACFSAVLRKNPRSIYAYYQRALAYKYKKEYEKALLDYSEIIRLTPNSSRAYYNRGHTYQAKKDYDQAVRDYSEAIRLEPKFAQAYNNRGNAFLAKKDYDRAIADYSEAIRLDAKHGFVHCNRGLAYQAKGDYARAIQDYLEALRLNPKEATAYNNLALVLATCPQKELRDGKKAIKYARKACELTGWKRGPYLETLAFAYAEARNFPEAVKWQTKALEAGFPDKAAEAKARERLQSYKGS